MINKKIKIALMSYAMDNRFNKGTGIYTRKLIENLLDDERLELYLVHFVKVDDPLYNRAHEIIMPSLNLPRGNHFFSQLLFFWQYRKNKFDIIHWFQPRVYPFYWLAPAKKIIITVHGAGEFTLVNKSLFSNWLFRNTLKYFNKAVSTIIADSENAKKEIAYYYKVKQEKLEVVYLGGGENYRPLDKIKSQKFVEHKYKISGSFILDVSRLTYNKNIDSLIEAYVIYRSKYKGVKKLVIVGSPMLGYQKTYDLVNNCCYKDDIYFINFVNQEDLNTIYSAAEVFVFPSLSEGFGLPIVEAMASGTPVITSNTTSLPEIAGEAAILVNPLNIEEIAQAIKNVLTDENLKQDLVKRGLEQSRKFSWAKTAEETKKIYLELFESIKLT